MDSAQVDVNWALSILIARVAQLESINDIKDYIAEFPGNRPD